mmetsp:Transcript_9033/g.8489  ORF Transcript_9033/g.8489 Transcript_9033/m.8489 type:complete len:80 (-) Transcript_9033:5634-5873(-)
MNGKGIPSESNASTKLNPVGNELHKGTRSYTKHHWIKEEGVGSIGPLEIKFDYPTSLISLNVDLYFQNKEPKLLQEQLS